jgi:hypothetical protein
MLMHPATELLLARMESNPEEFADRGHGRWADILADLGTVAPKDEWDILVNKVTAIHMDVIHKQIMQKLCTPEASPRQMSLLTSAEMKAHALELLNKGN